MAFGREKITKEDLKELGLDPELLQTLKDKGVTKDELTTLKTELLTSVTDQIKAGFTELEGKLKPAVNTNTNTNTNKEEEPDDQTRFLTDPAKFVKDEVNNLRGQAAVEIMKTRRDIALQNAQNNLKGFKNDTLKAEIMKELDEKYDAMKMARFGSDPITLIQQVHDMILGRHHDEIIQDTNKREGKYNLVHSGSSSNSNTNSALNSIGGKRQLSAEEKEMAKKYKMTEDEWLQQEKDMEEEEIQRRKVAV